MSALLAACGNNGGGRSDTVAPAVTNTTPENGAVMTPGDSIAINFNESIDSSSVVLGGDMAPESDGGMVTKSAKAPLASGIHSNASGNSLTISPQTTWSTGNDRTLSVNAKDVTGNSLPTLTLSYNIVEGIIYVRPPASGGSDSNDGTIDSPKATIPAAISEAANQNYIPGAVWVSEGTYQVNSSTPTHVVLMEKISIYGGYSADYRQRDPADHVTTIQDMSTATASPDAPNQAVEAGNGVTADTVVDGFTIRGGGGGYSSGIFNHDGASPTLRRNTIDGGGGVSGSLAIFNIASSPTIQNNLIYGGSSNAGNSYGIANSNFSSPSIQNNTIDGGSGMSSSYGVFNYNSSSPSIENNIVFTSPGTGPRYCLFVSGNSVAFVITNNDLFDCETALYSNSTAMVDLLDINDVNSLLGASDNASVDPEFADPNGPDDDINTMEDNDWHLTGPSPPEVTEGGLDLSSDFTDDKDGLTRTDPWSMGAYEW
jgi:Bacterial Ig-like domain